MPLVINTLGANTHTYTHTGAQTKAISGNQACAHGPHMPGLKIQHTLLI